MPTEWEFPWPKPISQYDTDGPRDGQAVIVHLVGADYTVEPTGNTGPHTGRDRFRVLCLMCNVEVHRNTTGPSSWIRSHHREAHGGQCEP